MLPLAQLVALKAEQEDIAESTKRLLSVPEGKERKALSAELAERQRECGELLQRLLEEAVR